MTQNPSEPGLAIYSKEWFDTIFKSTQYDPTSLFYSRVHGYARKSAEEIVIKWQLGSSSDPLMVAEVIVSNFLRHYHAT